MDFYTRLDQVLDCLRRRGRITSRALKRQFALDEALLEELKEELLNAQRAALPINRAQVLTPRKNVAGP